MISVFLQEDAMDRKTHAADGVAEGVFTEAQYRADVAMVIDHAAANGRAVVLAADGSPRVVITIPTHDLPVLDSSD
jgi:hypothetical protein